MFWKLNILVCNTIVINKKLYSNRRVHSSAASFENCTQLRVQMLQKIICGSGFRVHKKKPILGIFSV